MNKIKILTLCLLSVASLLPSQKSQAFTTSIFWQAVPNVPDAEFMFSNQNPAALESTYNAKGFSNITATSKEVVAALDAKVFSQYVEGPYFTAGLEKTLYITGQTNEPPLITKPVKKAAVDSNMFNARLASIGLKDVNVTAVGAGFDFNFTYLMKTGFIITQSPTLITPYYWCFDENEPSTCHWTYQPKEEYSKLYNKYNKDNFHPIDILRDIASIISQIFQSSLIKQTTNLTAQSFGPVSGIKMQAGTYFEQDNVLFAYHAITPGRGTTISNSTSLADVMEQQNTYPDMYPLEGVTTCGDNFGF